MSNLRLACRSMAPKRRERSRLNRASVSRQRKDWIMASEGNLFVTHWLLRIT